MIALLIANDHVLKFVFHNAVTGKLSDVAICFLMPLLISAALGLIAGSRVRRRLEIGAVVTVVVFSALEMSDLAPAAGSCARWRSCSAPGTPCSRATRPTCSRC